MFNPEQFADMQIEGANDTKIIPVPAGEYSAVIEKYEFREWRKKDDPTVSGVSMDVFWDIDDQSVRDLIGREKALVKQQIGLDFNANGDLDMGKGRNVGLGRLRDAVGQNKPGPWGFGMLTSAMAKVTVSHRADDRPTAQPGDVFAEVKAVTKLS